MGHINYMEPNQCVECGSYNTRMVRMDKDYNALFWFLCRDCGCDFIECYSLDSKGIPCPDEEE